MEDLAKSGDRTHRWPQVLPGGDAVLLTATKENSGSFENARVSVLSLKTGELKDIVRGGYYGRYLPNGYLVYIHHGSLFAVRFDAGNHETRGAAVAVLTDVDDNGSQGAGQFAFTRDGTLTYLSGGGSEQARVLAWLSADGTEEPVFGPFNLATPRISPDGKRIAVSLSGVLAVYDTKRDSLARLSSGDFHNPVWTPDGRRLLAGVAQSGISWLPSDGSAPAQSLYQSKDGLAFPTSVSPDGRMLAIQKTSGKTSTDIWMLPIESTPDGIRAGEPSASGFFRIRRGRRLFSPDRALGGLCLERHREGSGLRGSLPRRRSRRTGISYRPDRSVPHLVAVPGRNCFMSLMEDISRWFLTASLGGRSLRGRLVSGRRLRCSRTDGWLR